MPEELRIVVTDQGLGGTTRGEGGAPTSRAPSVPQPSRDGGAPAVRSPSGDKAAARREGEFRAAISQLQAAGASLASGRVGGAVAAGAGGLTAIAGPVGITAAALAAGLGVAAIAVRTFAKTIQTQTAQLAIVSQDVALAQAQTEIRRFRALIRRGREIGPELASAERLRARLEDELFDLGTQILRVLLRFVDAATPAVELFISFANKITTFIDKFGIPYVEVALALFTFLRDRFGIDLLGGDEDEQDPFVEEFLRLLPRPPLFWPHDQPIPGNARVDPGV